MVDEKIPLEACPREGCDEPILEAFRTDTPFQLRRQNMVVDKWCVIPRVDPASGDFFVYCVRHGEIEGFKTGNEVREEEATTDEGQEGTTDAALEEETTTKSGDTSDASDAPQASEDPNEDNPDASEPDVDVIDTADLPAFERAIVLYIEKEGSATRAMVQGKMLERDKSPDEVQAALEWLKEQGYIVEHEDAVYKVVDG